MSYSIQYGPRNRKRPSNKQRVNLLALIAAVLIPLFVLTIGFHPDTTQQVKSTLLPWEQEYVQAAFADFSASVQGGTSLKDAVTALYTQIIHAAQSE